MLWSKIGTSIQGARARKSQKRGKTDSPSCDPLAITIDRNRRNGIKNAAKEHQGTQTSEKGLWFHDTLIHMSWQKTLIQEVGTRGLNPHLTGSMRIKKERTREDRRTVPVFSRPTRHGSGRGLKERRQIPLSLDPHHLVGHHDLCATRSALAIPWVHTGAVVTTGTIEM